MSKEEYELALEQLRNKVSDIDYVQEFQRLEALIKSDKEIWTQEEKMKDLQKEGILFQKIDKHQAYETTMGEARAIEEELNANPLIRQYRSKLEDVSDLLQYITGELEDRINNSLQLIDGEEKDNGN